jgi:hypothetical protein
MRRTLDTLKSKNCACAATLHWSVYLHKRGMFPVIIGEVALRVPECMCRSII